MEPGLSTALAQRPQWTIDLRLEQLLGQEVRVGAEAFFPVRWNGEVLPAAIPVRDLILPDNTQPGLLPVFFEGRLRRFERRIGVVFVTLDAPVAAERSAEGMLFLRGMAAVLLRGPAVVQLAVPFRVERLPDNIANYWEDLRFPAAQFRLPFVTRSSK